MVRPNAEVCCACQRPFPPWIVEAEVWNAVRPDPPNLCVSCFITGAEAVGVRPFCWELRRFDGDLGDEYDTPVVVPATEK